MGHEEAPENVDDVHNDEDDEVQVEEAEWEVIPDKALFDTSAKRSEFCDEIKLIAPQLSPDHQEIKDFLRSFQKRAFIPHTILDKSKSPSDWPATDSTTGAWWDDGIDNEPILPDR